MQEPNNFDIFMSFVPLIILTIPLFFICRSLAQEKGRNVNLWSILGIIPAVNYFAVIYLVGAKNNILENKLDKIIELIQIGTTPGQK